MTSAVKNRKVGIGFPGIPSSSFDPSRYKDETGGQQNFTYANGDVTKGRENPAYVDGEDEDDDDDDDDHDSEGDSNADADVNNHCSSIATTDDVADLKDFEDELSPETEEAAPSQKVGWKDTGSILPPVDTSAVQMREPTPARKKPKWDIFTTSTSENFSGENIRFWNRIFLITKIVVCFLLFIFVLGTSVLTKVIFLLVTSNIFPANSHFNTSHRTARFILTFRKGPLKEEPYTDVQWIWAMMLIMGAPYLFTIGRCIWRLVFQLSKRRGVDCSTVLAVLSIETVHSIGLHVLVFVVIPNLDPISGSMLSLNVALVPGYLKILYPVKSEDSKETCQLLVTRIVAVIVALVHTGGLALWSYYVIDANLTIVVCTIVSPIFISVKWWENFVHQAGKDDTSNGLPVLARAVRRSRTKLSLLVSLWKLILTLVIPIGIFGISCGDIQCIGTLYFQNDLTILNSSKSIGYTQLVDSTQSQHNSPFGDMCNMYLPFVLAAISILCSGICYKSAKMACKIVAQEACFSLPLALSTPVAVILFIGAYVGVESTSATGCTLPFPYTKIGISVFIHNLEDYWKIMAAGLAGYLSLLFIISHVWTPSSERLMRTDKLFVQPLYCGVLLETSLLLNRRRDDDDKNVLEAKTRKMSVPLPEVKDVDPSGTVLRSHHMTDETPMLYLCATMWHETENEMAQILKSIFRMDEDQCTKFNFQRFFNKRDPDYYEFEAHIFFDDAFEKHMEDEYDYKVNGYVKQLMQIIPEAAKAVMSEKTKIAPPTKIPTPYGGQLIWKLPGGNKLVAHLKDKVKIRHRKRWSQVMYMYYFLAHKLISQPYKQRKLEKIAKNTFILALDGDVDFQPKAVRLLIDRMRKNPAVGAACGRIHPIGNGAMVWYQKFEYAVSHWLQKAAEDKLGVVLCSPGCFSLFRGFSLMDDNVMQRYTTPPTEARHYVQYDQGEDRWLCTLLLQQGHKVEYCAASDALTYAPEGFYEFYNQRRRWTPSTMANILDLLTDWKNVTRRNNDVALLYVFYQGLLMVSSILTPGTIFLLVFGAINMAYPSIALWHAMLVNLIPVVIFVLLCFLAKKQTQLTYAGVLSVLYSLVMMIVLVGLLRNAAEYGLCSVTTIFLLFVAGVFVLSALLHPQEFWCLIHGCLYFLAIPSMSMLLMIFSLANINDVTWGTRETSNPTVVSKAGEGERKQTQEGFRGLLQGIGSRNQADNVESDYQFSLGNLFRCICCPKESTPVYNTQLHTILERLDDMEYRLSTADQQTTRSDPSAMSSRNKDSSRSHVVGSSMEPFSKSADIFEGSVKENPLYKDDENQTSRDELKNPFWAEDKDLAACTLQYIEPNEIKFWQELIDKYLYPLNEDNKKQDKVKQDLRELRNKVCLIFILINALFVTIVFALQQVTSESGSLSLALPCARDSNAGQRIEPISVAFTLVFGILLFVQFICMLLHRMATLLHVMAATEIFKTTFKHKTQRTKKNEKDEESSRIESTGSVTIQEVTRQDCYELIKDMQRLKDDDTASVVSRSSTIVSLESDEADEVKDKDTKPMWRRKRRDQPKANTSLRKNFEANVEAVCDALQQDGNDEFDGSEQTKGKERKVQQLQEQTKFKRFARKSLHTIVHLKEDKRLNEALIKSTNIYRWKSAFVKASAKNGNQTFAKITELVVAKQRQNRVEQETADVQVHPGTPATDHVVPSSGPHAGIMKKNFAAIAKLAVQKEREEAADVPMTPLKEESEAKHYKEIQGPLVLKVPHVADDESPEENEYADVQF